MVEECRQAWQCSLLLPCQPCLSCRPLPAVRRILGGLPQVINGGRFFDKEGRRVARPGERYQVRPGAGWRDWSCVLLVLVSHDSVL